MNTFGERVRLTTFGESHGPAIGGVIDGFPAGFKIDFDFLARRMAERRPGQRGTTQRREDDLPEFLSGLTPEGLTLGTPIGFIIRNKDTRSQDYGKLATAYRPNHADYTYRAKYGLRDHRGGGRASARETACRVVAGALAEQWLLARGVAIEARLTQVGTIRGSHEKLMEEVERVRLDLDSVGGIVECTISGLPAGVGDPVFGKLNARLAAAMMSINAAKGVEIGDGFEMATKRGSEVIDEFYIDSDNESGNSVKTRTNHNGGVLGGISTGMPVTLRVAFKPTPTIGKPLPLLSEEGETFIETVPGRHDPCVAVRAVPVVRAMAALTVIDSIL
ncbi:MAG: chorismate synthase [Muribaculaceae bacterium]|nr:chorismate synthase [Muribaculaceae bacterium]